MRTQNLFIFNFDMKKFILKILLFSVAFLMTTIGLGLFLPPTPRASKSLLFAKIKKDSLLISTISPRIIFVGGSNLSFGLNSKTIKDSLKLNPINTAIQGAIGLQHMMDNTIQYVNQGDIVVLAPEYEHFYGSFVYGGEELLRTVVDVKFLQLKLLQVKSIYKFIPKLSFSKLNPFEYFGFEESDIYSVNSFNEFGDVYTHFGMKQREFSTDEVLTEYNPHTIDLINDFRINTEKKGATLYVTYPGYQASSFDKRIKQIKRIEKELLNSEFELLGTPERYRMSDTLMFNTPYHLLKEGINHRTQLLIEDIRNND